MNVQLNQLYPSNNKLFNSKGIDIYINGGYHTTIILSEFFPEDTVDVPITGSPCGSIITAHCVPSGFSSATYDVTATMEVLSIT